MISIETDSAVRLMPKTPAAGSRTKAASLNALAAAVDYGARLLVGFVLNPLLVYGLGDYGFGVWQVLRRLIGYVSPATGRPTQALKWVIASHQSSSDYNYKRRQVGSALLVLLIFIPVMVILGGILTWFAPVWLAARGELITAVRLAAALLFVNLIVLSLVELPRSILEGENLGYKRMGLSAGLVLVGGGLTGLALYLDGGLVGVAFATLATTVLTGVLFLIVVRTHVPWFGVARPSASAIRQFAGLSGWFLAWNLISKSMMASDVLLLGFLDSAESVTVYSLTKYAPEAVISLVAIVVFGITPGLGSIIGSGDMQKAARVRGEIMCFSWLVLTACGVTILLWNPSFLRLWVGPDYYAGTLPTLLMVVVVVQFVFIRNDANIIDLTLDLRRKVQIGMFSSLLSLLIAGVLVAYFEAGITGLLLGYLIGRSVLSLSYPWLVGDFLQIPLVSQLRTTLRPTISTVLLLGTALVAGPYVTVGTWTALVPAVAVTVMLSSILSFATGLSSDQRQQLVRRARHLAKARS